MTWEERWHPLREEWVIVAAHRQNRPWTGETLKSKEAPVPAYAADCYLCPGNARVSGAVNPHYTSAYVFDNDHPCVGMSAPMQDATPGSVLRSRPAQGVARVVCYSPNHNTTLAELNADEMCALLSVWSAEYKSIGARPEVTHVLTFENKGEVVGVSNPHPHCQIYGTNFVFKNIETEVKAGEKHLGETGRVLFQDVISAEKQDGRRILFENSSAIAFVPYFARYAYEVYVAPRQTHASLANLSLQELNDFGDAMRAVLVMYDNLWQMPFPYVMALHQAPTDGRSHPGFHFHAEFHPPLRKPNLLKYLAGPEIGGGSFLSDTAPEDKAAELRNQSPVHYRLAKQLPAAS